MKSRIIDHISYRKGFTLIELLVGISIIGIAGVVLVGILVVALQGSGKSVIVSDIKQNGSYAVEQMTRILQSAKTVNLVPCTPSATTQTLTVTQLDSSQAVIDCSGNTITVKGNSLLDTTTVKLVPGTCTLTCSQQAIAAIPIIRIQFSLTQSTAAGVGGQSSVFPFQTSILLRNAQ